MKSNLFALSGMLQYMKLSESEISYLENKYGKNWFQELYHNLVNS